MKYLPAVFVLIFFLGSCKDDASADKQTEVIAEDSTERLDTIFSQGDIDHLRQLKFSAYAQSQNSPINWSNFKMVTSSQNESLVVTRFQPAKSFYDMYGRFLKFSPDSSMFVDIDSYNIEFQKNKAGQLIPLEKGPDTEVSLVNRETAERTRLVFLGPGNGVEDASWTDNNNVLLVGYHEKDTSKTRTPVIWRYHVPTKTFHVYESSDTSISRKLINWRKERLK